MAVIKDVLNKFRVINGLELALVVDTDGTPIDSFNRSNMDLNEVAAVASTGLQMAGALGGAASRGQTRQAILEFTGGTIVLEPLSDDVLLVVVASDSSSIGQIRYITRQYHDELLNALPGVAVA